MQVDPTAASDHEIRRAVEGFHAYLSEAGFHISVYNSFAVWVHNFYNLTRALDVNSKLTSRLRKQVAQNPVTAQHAKYTDSYFQHTVYDYLSRMRSSRAFLDGDAPIKERLLRQKYVYYLTNDTHSRAADLCGLPTVEDSCCFRNSSGKVVKGADIRGRAATCRMRFLSTKTARGCFPSR